MLPWDTPEIHNEAKKRVSHSSQQVAEQYAHQIEIAVETTGEVLEVRTVMPAQQEIRGWVEWFFSLDWLFEWRAREASVSYSISTPRRMNTTLVSTNGGVQIGAIEGRADLHTTNEAVTAEGTQGAVRGHTTNGAISLLQVAGGCHAVTTNGKITAQLLALGSQGCELQTTKRAIHITLPENIRADLDASTTNGNVTSALSLSLQGKISQRGMEGKINGGGPPLKLRTRNGGITIQRAAVQDALYQLPDSARDQMKEKGVDVEQLPKAVLKHPKIGKLVEIQDVDSRVEIAIE